MQYAAEVLVSFHWLKICSAYVDPKACAVGIVSSITPWTQIQTHCTAVWVWEHLWKQRKALSYPKLPSQAWIQTTPRSPMGLQGAQGGSFQQEGWKKPASVLRRLFSLKIWSKSAAKGETKACVPMTCIPSGTLSRTERIFASSCSKAGEPEDIIMHK